MAPTIRKGSTPLATASGSGASGGSWERSSSQAKNLRNGRRPRVTQHVDVAVVLRQTFRERFPLVAARAAAIHAQPSFGRIVLRVTLDRDDVDGIRLVRVNVDREPEVRRQVPADLPPRFTGVV